MGYSGGKRKYMESVLGYKLPKDAAPLIKGMGIDSSLERIVKIEQTNVGVCKHGLSVGCSFCCN